MGRGREGWGGAEWGREGRGIVVDNDGEVIGCVVGSEREWRLVVPGITLKMKEDAKRPI